MSVSLENMSDYAKNLVKELQLEAHPEGGWYTRDWQAAQLYLSLIHISEPTRPY